jgi:hypothetical protein
MPGLPIKPDHSFPPILGIVFYKDKKYQYLDRKLGKLLDIFYQDRHTWMQWVFHFEKELLCFSEHDPHVKDIICVSNLP